jgi:PAS domain S-box-containing protein
MEEALRESGAFSSSLMENSAIPMMVVNNDTSMRYVNPAFKKLTGFTSEEVIGKIAPYLWWIEDAASGNIDELRKHGHTGIRGLEKLFQKKNGEQFWVEVTSAPVKRHGKFQYNLENWLDITERKQMERALRESEEKFSKAFQASPNIMAIISLKDRKIIEINENYTLSTGYTREEVIGHNAAEFDSWVDDVEHKRILRILEKEGRVHSEEMYSRKKSGEINVGLLSIELVNISGEPCMLTESIDITRLKKTEEKLKEAMANLEQSSAKLAVTNKELETFSYSVSHDLRSPLRSIDGFSQALLEDYRDRLDEHGQEYLNRLRSASQKMGELIDGLLKLSRLTRSEMHQEKVDLSALAEEIATRLQETQPDRRAKFIIGSGLTANGDPQLLRVLLENLLGNAWKFTSKIPRAEIEFGISHNGDKKTFFVKDNGAGFDMTYANKLFGAFQRLHDTAEFPGTGIGLATVQRIINRHSGNIRAEGAVGKGATFYFTLE